MRMVRTSAMLHSAGKADISFAAMNGADLTGADLSRTKAMGTVFKDADLTGADLSRADLDGAELATAKTMDGVKVSGRELMASDLGDDVAMPQDNAGGTAPGGTAHRSRPLAGGPKVGRPLTKLPRASWKKRDSNTWLAATDEYWLAVDRVKGPVNGPQWAYRLRHGARGSEGMDDGQTYETLDAAKRAGFHARGRGRWWHLPHLPSTATLRLSGHRERTRLCQPNPGMPGVAGG